MATYEPIDCGHYDYLEIACMDRYELVLQLDDKDLCGTAVDVSAVDAEEFLTLQHDDGSESAVRVDQIRHVKVVTRPARFTEVRFRD